jgi:hypothetical protein
MTGGRHPAPRNLRGLPAALLAFGLLGVPPLPISGRTRVLVPALSGAAVFLALYGGGLAAQADPAAGAYLDEPARELVERARERRAMLDRSIQAYETVARERLSVELEGRLRDRLLYRRETVSRLFWQRDDSVRVEVLGAREVVPPVVPRVSIPTDLAGTLPALAFDPVDSEMLLPFEQTRLRHPLAEDGEEHYRYASGDSLTLGLPDGTTVRVLELRVRSRRRDPELVNGSLWLDAETHSVVRAYVALSRAYDSERDTDRPGLAAAILPRFALDLNYLAIEYALWESQWWMPSLLAGQGTVEVGGTRVPIRYERTYSAYEIQGVPASVPAALDTLPDPGRRHECLPIWNFRVEVSAGGAADTAGVRRPSPPSDVRRPPPPSDIRARAAADTAFHEVRGDTTRITVRGPECERVFVVHPEPGADLQGSSFLPPSIYDPAAGPVTRGQLRDIQARIAELPAAPWRREPPTLQVVTGGPGLIRYNGVEGLSVGARAKFDFGRLESDAVVRFGTADREIGLEVGTGYTARSGREWRAGGYRRLDTMDERGRAFGISSSLDALLFGRDEHDYFRATGGEIAGARAGPRAAPNLTWRVFAERQTSVERETDVSLRRALRSGHRFRPNPPAADADQVGLDASLRLSAGRDPLRLRGGLRLGVLAEAGDFEFVRPHAALHAGLPLGRRWVGAFEAAAGGSVGELSPQRAWRLGGAGTLRGYDPASAEGTAYWRGRAEIGTASPAARLSMFTDVGWAGPRDAFSLDDPLWSVGVGFGLVDGLIRFDLARALRGDPGDGWRLHMVFDGLH